MSLIERATFIVPVSDRQVLVQNLLASPLLRSGHPHEVLIQEGFVSAGRAYNQGLVKATNELLIFLHSDMYLPNAWMSQLENALCFLEQTDPRWGVLGCWGTTQTGECRGHIYSTGWGVLGKYFDYPLPVQTLDEIVLIVKKSSKLEFNEQLPHFHFYGADICMRAARRKMKSYVIPAFCVHNTTQIVRMPPEFYSCYRHFRRIWRKDLPIQTPCIRVSKSNIEMYTRRLKENMRHVLRRDTRSEPRLLDPSRIFHDLQATTADVDPC